MFPIRSHRSTGTLSSASGAASAILRARAAEWEVELAETPESLTMHVWGSELCLIPEDGAVRIELRAPEQRIIGLLQDNATELFESHGMSIKWDNVNEGALTSGLALMQVVSVTQRTSGFIRIRVQGEEAARFGQGSLHFRLLIPPQGREAKWPRIAANGRTIWPEGEDALHRPVYTVADQAGDWVDFDIYRHTGSPTCDWADRVQPGEIVGLLGPGGGWCSEAATLRLFGDETALPAIARMLALTKGEARVWLRCGAQDLGHLADDPRVTRCDDLMAALHTADLGEGEDRHVFFAGPAQAARDARRHLVDRGLNKRQFITAAYWGQPDSRA
ncbi:siderophore-interacting protein [Paracoccus laeviglucosivorans]|uniref:NADPH-dependent ferric siderophore reductase, contains FAD-binding and SIP domains n=1 Tax=Paracoccus laeviglucosivorans TaxID=1197861 RepID=A0A521BBJ9_9RHOB|nr:siderophore-interacting protein [Paracoccus laeviglucosivorans]SMO44438.1 NADPH-dependent ferric siderophore reductase, contains FAD-binding and SIP domains [Paracoccus laeviglucosivorans]